MKTSSFQCIFHVTIVLLVYWFLNLKIWKWHFLEKGYVLIKCSLIKMFSLGVGSNLYRKHVVCLVSEELISCLVHIEWPLSLPGWTWKWRGHCFSFNFFFFFCRWFGQGKNWGKSQLTQERNVEGGLVGFGVRRSLRKRTKSHWFLKVSVKSDH